MKISQHRFIESSIAHKLETKADVTIRSYRLNDAKNNPDVQEEIRKRRIAAVKAFPTDTPIAIQECYSHQSVKNDVVPDRYGKGRVGFAYSEIRTDKDGNFEYSGEFSENIVSSQVAFKHSNVDSVIKDVEAHAKKHGLEFDEVEVRKVIARRLPDVIRDFASISTDSRRQEDLDSGFF